MLVIEPHDRHQQWLGGVPQKAASAILDRVADRANGATGITPEGIIREGDKAQEILKLIDEDEDISTFVLAAGTVREGPGPLVSSLGRTAGTFPIPVTIVPGHLSDEDLDAVS